MNRTIYILSMLLAALLSACSSDSDGAGEDANAATDGMVAVSISVPGVLSSGPLPSASTRSQAIADAFGTEPPLTYLPVGSTLWLAVQKKDDDGTYEPADIRGYVVGSNSGYNSLFACNTVVNAKGEMTIDVGSQSGVPLYLKAGTYKFRIMSPALDISASTLATRIENGMYFYSSDERYDETKSQDIKIEANHSGVQNIRLNPMVQQVAQIRIDLLKGRNVYDIEMLDAGVEISGLQNPQAIDGSNVYNWSSSSEADTLRMKMGDKQTWTSIPGSGFAPVSGISIGGIAYDGLRGAAGVLPTDARLTNIVVLVSMAVNGVPTQYEFTMRDITLLHGRSYNVQLLIEHNDEGLSVTKWLNHSWNAGLTLE